MDDYSVQPIRRRRRPPLAPWEKALRKYWPPVRLALLGAIAAAIIVLCISCAVAAFI